MKLNIALVILLVVLSTVRVFAYNDGLDVPVTGLEFETIDMTDEQIDIELDELVDIKAIDGVKFSPNEGAQ